MVKIMNKELRDNRCEGSDFVCCVSEMVGGYNDRGISIDMVKLLEESWIEMECKDDDLKYIKECFEDDWNDKDCGWLYWEVKEIREWLDKK
jgi:hypothetical protein